MSDVTRRAGRSVGAVAALALAATGFAALPANAADADQVTIDIAAISDFHGHVENAGVLATYVNSMRAANPNTIFAANGDLVGGSEFVSAIQDDQPTLDILNAMKLQVSATGNHEYDKGYPDLLNRIVPKAQWPYLVSNVAGVDSSKIAPTTTITTDSGVKVAFVGAVTDQLKTLVSPDGIAGLTITDPVAAVNAQAAALKDGNAANGEADVVVALIHETTGVATGVGANVDAVVSGHTHHNDKATTAFGAPIIEPGSFGQFAGHIAITYDTATNKVVTATAKVDALDTKNGVKDPAIDKMYKDAKAVADVLGAAPVGNIKGGADRATNSGKDLGANRGAEMTAANLMAEAFQQYKNTLGKEAAFGIMNPGGVRADIDPNRDGVVTKGESFSAQPFSNSYGIVDLTGAQVYTMLEQQWADASTQTSRPMLQLGISKSLTYTYDANAAFGSHIKQVFLNGKLIDRADTTTLYSVASNAFLLAGGDGFNVFKAGVNFVDTGMMDNEVFNAFLAANPNHVVDYSQRNIAISGETALVSGKPATLDLASLSMTYATDLQPLPTTVSVALDGTKIGQADIDNTITPDRNETGKASVAVTVPKGTAGGAHSLTVTAGPTVMTIPVTVTDNPVSPIINPAKDRNIFFAGDLVSPVVEIAAKIAAADQVIAGDWNGDGVDTIALRNGRDYTFLAANRTDAPSKVISFGPVGSTPVVGDFNGDGADDLAVRAANSNAIYFKFASNGEILGGYADGVTDYGRATDTLIAGDWDGSAGATFGIKRGGTYMLKNSIGSGAADYTFNYGRATDRPIVGDWNGDGTDTVSIMRGAVLYVNNGTHDGYASSEFRFGRDGDQIVAGDWFGEGSDTIAAYRR